jgi:hypothetical protein
MTRGIPPGIHIQATVAIGGGPMRQLRIFGDDQRGYLIAGLLGIPRVEDEEFWFGTLGEALDSAARFGVPREAWTEITAMDQVRTARR